jgi:hypothetical protein
MQSLDYNLYTIFSFKTELMKQSKYSAQLTSKKSKKEDKMMLPAKLYTITWKPILTFIALIKLKNPLH